MQDFLNVTREPIEECFPLKDLLKEGKTAIYVAKNKQCLQRVFGNVKMSECHLHQITKYQCKGVYFKEERTGIS